MVIHSPFNCWLSLSLIPSKFLASCPPIFRDHPLFLFQESLSVRRKRCCMMTVTPLQQQILHSAITSVKAGTKSLFLSLRLILYLLTHALPVPLYHIKTRASGTYLAGLFIAVIGFLLWSFLPHASLMNMVNLGTPYRPVPCTGFLRE